jgi:CHASE3 domain sensor protein
VVTLLPIKNLFLPNITSSRNNADSTFKHVKLRTIDNTVQQNQLDTLKSLINSKFSWMENVFQSLIRQVQFKTNYRKQQRRTCKDDKS